MSGNGNKKGCLRWIGWFSLFIGVMTPIRYFSGSKTSPSETIGDNILAAAGFIAVGLLLVIVPGAIAKARKPQVITLDEELVQIDQMVNILAKLDGMEQRREEPVPQVPERKETVVRCSGCGATNKVWTGETVSCQYCGSPIKG